MTERPSTGPVQYKGDDLDAERGPGLGCFRFQVALLVFLIVLTPLSVAWHWPEWLSAVVSRLAPTPRWTPLPARRVSEIIELLGT